MEQELELKLNSNNRFCTLLLILDMLCCSPNLILNDEGDTIEKTFDCPLRGGIQIKDKEGKPIASMTTDKKEWKLKIIQFD
jgi:hypothetical protein